MNARRQYGGGRVGTVRAAPMSRSIPLHATASFFITPAEFTDKNRLPALYRPLYFFRIRLFGATINIVQREYSIFLHLY